MCTRGLQHRARDKLRVSGACKYEVRGRQRTGGKGVDFDKLELEFLNNILYLSYKFNFNYFLDFLSIFLQRPEN